MKTYYINEPMRRYGESTDALMKTMPKHSKPYGVKQPELRNVIAIIAAVIFVLVVITQVMH